jgi:glycosyltransferase involved in cell wall biosynthesis
MGDLPAARRAVAEALRRHMVWPDISGLAGQVAQAVDAPGWCGLTSTGAVVVHPVYPGGINPPIDIRIDGTSLKQPDAMMLPATWPRAQSVTVTEGAKGSQQRHFIGSPISLRAIGRVEGYVESLVDGIRGWAWCPGDSDADPHLAVGAGRTQRKIIAAGTTSGIHGLAPLARPRAFAVPWDELPGGNTPIQVRGRDGRNLAGSPIARYRPGSVETSRSRLLPARQAGPVGPATSRNGTTVSAALRRQPDLAQWRDGTMQAVVLVTHDDGGGVERRVQTSVAAHEAMGRRAIVLRPAKSPNSSAMVVAASGSLPDLRFELPRERRSLLRLLAGMQPVAAELHHFLNHDATVFEIIRVLGVPYDAYVHDYAWFCPRIALVGRGDRYCGEPAQDVCQTCVTQLGGYLHEDIGVAALLDRSMTILSGAKRIIAPSHDAAARLARHFPGISPIVIPHEDDTAMAEPPPVPCVSGMVRVCVAGAIGLHKGFHVLLACARDAKHRNLDLTFVVAGTTIDDPRLMETGHVFVTGPYQPDEAVALIRDQGAALALLPSIWPETWCLGLTELWRAGLRVAAFDIGAPAERIRRTGRGFLLPLHLTPAAINDTLLKAARGRSLQLPIREPSDYKVSY